MLVDSFLFFQELDLLEIRLEYLDPFVDKFLIVEARQTFKGSIKEYIFEKNIQRYSKYINKIKYYKLEDIHNNYVELLTYLEKSNYELKLKIKDFIQNHTFYDKDNLSHILDTYHRECIHMVLDEVCCDDDIVLFSDLDEIPAFELIKNIKDTWKLNKIVVFIQHEFKYFLNNYAGSYWYGSIAAPYRLIKNHSLNDLRFNSKNLSKISYAGYHFTSIGDKQSIIKKIESWAHQEFNHKIVKDNIEENLINGKDIFYRFNESKNKCLNIGNTEIIDERMRNILLRFDKFIIKRLNYNFFFEFKYLYLQLKFNFIRVRNNPKKFLKKILKFLVNK